MMSVFRTRVCISKYLGHDLGYFMIMSLKIAISMAINDMAIEIHGHEYSKFMAIDIEAIMTMEKFNTQWDHEKEGRV